MRRMSGLIAVASCLSCVSAPPYGHEFNPTRIYEQLHENLEPTQVEIVSAEDSDPLAYDVSMLGTLETEVFSEVCFKADGSSASEADLDSGGIDWDCEALSEERPTDLLVEESLRLGADSVRLIEDDLSGVSVTGEKGPPSRAGECIAWGEQTVWTRRCASTNENGHCTLWLTDSYDAKACTQHTLIQGKYSYKKSKAQLFTRDEVINEQVKPCKIVERDDVEAFLVEVGDKPELLRTIGCDIDSWKPFLAHSSALEYAIRSGADQIVELLTIAPLPEAWGIDQTSGKAGARAMARIPAGELARSEPDPRYLDAFSIDVTEVTVEAYRECVRAGFCSEPVGEQVRWELTGLESYVGDPVEGQVNYFIKGREDHPVNSVNWYQASAYCRWRGQRLPSEWEWERAATGDDGWIYPWGDEEPSFEKSCPRVTTYSPCTRPIREERDFDEKYRLNRMPTSAVGSVTSPDSPYGLYNMSDNVAEWTSSVSDKWRKVVRGGSVISDEPEPFSSRRRVGAAGAYSVQWYRGFRCAQ